MVGQDDVVQFVEIDVGGVVNRGVTRGEFIDFFRRFYQLAVSLTRNLDRASSNSLDVTLCYLF